MDFTNLSWRHLGEILLDIWGEPHSLITWIEGEKVKLRLVGGEEKCYTKDDLTNMNLYLRRKVC